MGRLKKSLSIKSRIWLFSNTQFLDNSQLVVNIGYVSVEMADFFFIARPNTSRL